MKNTFFSKRIWLVAMLAALVLIFTLSAFADAASANTETSAIDLISYQVKADENGAFSVRLITGVDSLDYKYCIYTVDVTARNTAGNDVTTTLMGRENYVYSSIFGGQTEYAVSEISDYPYASLVTVKGLRTASSYIKLKITPMVVTADGEKVSGKTVFLVYNGEPDGEGYPAFEVGFADEEAPRHTVVLDPEKQSEMSAYLPDSWQTKLESISISDTETFAFALQTDTHYTIYNNSNEKDLNCLKALTHFLPLDFIANTGDLIKGYQAVEENTPANSLASMKELVRRYTEDVNSSVLLTFGNHDTNQIWCKQNTVPSDQFNQQDFYDLVVSNLETVNGDNMTTNGESAYYYVDFPHDEIRVIMLNTSDGDYVNSFGSLSKISNAQAAWFRDVALDTEYSVLVMMHVPLLTEFPENESWQMTNSDAVRNAVNAFVDNGGDFIAYMYGHNHLQETMVDSDGRRHISFTNNSERAEIITIDKAARKIVTYGLGANVVDREFDY